MDGRKARGQAGDEPSRERQENQSQALLRTQETGALGACTEAQGAGELSGRDISQGSVVSQRSYFQVEKQ